MQRATFDNNRVPQCPCCNKRQPNPDNRWCYGSPIRSCPHCGTEYMDERYREIAIDGYIPNSLSPKRSLSIAAIGLAFALGANFMRLHEINTTGRFHTILYAFAIMGVAMLVGGIVDLLNIITGAKKKTFEKLNAESVERMKNPDYVKKLLNAGISVPKGYIPLEKHSDDSDYLG